jgi:hypothetical protein
MSDVVDEHVDAPVLLERPRRHPLDVGPRGDVALHDLGFGARVPDFFGGPFGALGGAAVVEQDLCRALLRRTRRQGGAEPGAGARDHERLALESTLHPSP